MATEFVDAPRLASLLEADPGWDIPARMAVLLQIVDGLEYARELGLFHLHLRPANVLIDADRAVKIAGFGVARVRSAIAAASGTAVADRSPYAAPERAQGKPGDHRSDVFSLARIALDLLAPSGDRALPAALSALGVSPDRWLAIFDRALAADPADRFDGAAELEVELLLMLGVAAVPGHSTQTSRTFFGPIPRRSSHDNAVALRESDLDTTKTARERFILGQSGDDPTLPSRRLDGPDAFGDQPTHSGSAPVDRKR
jgi:serine/threonine-protein kinase